MQYAPELLRQIKYLIDQKDDKGKVIITSSQTYNLMYGTSESLAGRIAVVSMPSLFLREIKHGKKANPFIPKREDVQPKSKIEWNELWAQIQRGSMPFLQDKEMD